MPKSERSRSASPVRRRKSLLPVLSLVIHSGELSMNELYAVFETCKRIHLAFVDFVVSTSDRIRFLITSLDRWHLLRFFLRHQPKWHRSAHPVVDYQTQFDAYVKFALLHFNPSTPVPYDPLEAAWFAFFELLETCVTHRSKLVLSYLQTKGSEQVRIGIQYRHYIFLWRKFYSDQIRKIRELAMNWAYAPAVEYVDWFYQGYDTKTNGFNDKDLPLPHGIEYEL